MWGKRYTHTLLVGLRIGTTTLESSMEFLRKLGTEQLFDPAIPLLGLYPKSAYYSETVTSMFIAAQFIIADCGTNRGEMPFNR